MHGHNKIKGISLPINVIVIVAVAVLVLMVVAAFFVSGTGGSQTAIIRQQALDSACQNLKTLYNCERTPDHREDIKVSYQDVGESSPQPHSLGDICKKLNFADQNQCYLRCGCSSTAGAQPTPTAAAGAATPAPTATPASGGQKLEIPG